MPKRKKPRSTLSYLRKAGVLIKDNHFVLQGKAHSDSYLDKNKLLIDTHIIYILTRRMAFAGIGMGDIDIVVGPEKGGIVLAHRVAHFLNLINKKNGIKKNVLAIFAEKAGNLFGLLRGYDKLVRNKKVLIVEDILTTGDSVKRLAECVKSEGGDILGVVAIANRGDVKAEDVGVSALKSLARIRLQNYPADKCPLCARKVPINTELGHGKEYLESRAALPPPPSPPANQTP